LTSHQTSVQISWRSVYSRLRSTG